MRVCHYFEFSEHITGGVSQSVAHQRNALQDRAVDLVTEPSCAVDVVHLNVMGPRSLYLARNARKQDIPVVAHSHVTAEDFRRSFRFSNALAYVLKPYLSHAYGAVDHLICPTPYTATVVRNYCDTPTHVVSNGVDTEKLDGYDDGELREEYLDRFDVDPPVVFMLGHMIQRKGLDTFLATAEAMPDTDFVWVGPKLPRLKDRKTRKQMRNAPENCRFPGYIEDVRGAFAAGDIFFFPTHEENQGIALLEAMACAKPVVVRDIDTFQDWLVHEEHCLKADTVDGFKQQLTRLKQDRSLRTRIGEQARELADSHTLDRVGDALLDVYQEALQGR